MKKMKGIAAVAMESSPSAYVPLYDDARTRFKHQSLLQDFEELYKETEAKKLKLQMMRNRKLTLLDEVRFLHRRYKYLTENQAWSPPLKRNSGKSQKLVNGSRSARKEKNFSRKDAASRHQIPHVNSNQTEEFHHEPAPLTGMKQKQKTHIQKDSSLRSSFAIPDLNQRERIYSGKEADVRSNAPIFDLNEISMEEEDMQANSGVVRVDEPKLISMRSGNDDHNDIKLAACRNLSNGSGQAGKRKISWQDPVALRV
ncbi:hypothetical protein K2173_015871 [Erythroxylum novogranatense]|uniref:Uncharacterized protein n=1 Tax=Erythroxylum novogranatense TaxID=1862640 RepID=A0AAV8SFI7_9ROSI|nr:hypothetical protein K2173_015871 [Erythroxylum novogranatense]